MRVGGVGRKKGLGLGEGRGGRKEGESHGVGPVARGSGRRSGKGSGGVGEVKVSGDGGGQEEKLRLRDGGRTGSVVIRTARTAHCTHLKRKARLKLCRRTCRTWNGCKNLGIRHIPR